MADKRDTGGTPSSSFDFWKRSERRSRNSRSDEFTSGYPTSAERDRLKFRVFCAISGVDPEGADAARQLRQLMDRAGLRDPENSQARDLEQAEEHRRQCLIYGIDPASSEKELHRARCSYWNVPELLAPDRKSLNQVLKIRYHCQDEHR